MTLSSTLGRWALGAAHRPPPAAINYKYGDTISLNITTGSGADTINALATGVTDLTFYRRGLGHVNVGSGGSVQGILGTLNLQNPPNCNTINVSDSADTTARTVTLSTYSSGGDELGLDHRAGAGGDQLKYFDTSSVNITTGSGNDTVNVLATGVTTNITGGTGRRQCGQRRQRAGHPRHADPPEPAQLQHDQRQRLGRHDGADRDAEHLQLGRRQLGLDHRAGSGGDRLQVLPTPAA